MADIKITAAQRQALSQRVRRGLLRELCRQGRLTQEQFARLMEKERDR